MILRDTTQYDVEHINRIYRRARFRLFMFSEGLMPESVLSDGLIRLEAEAMSQKWSLYHRLGLPELAQEMYDSWLPFWVKAAPTLPGQPPFESWKVIPERDKQHWSRPEPATPAVAPSIGERRITAAEAVAEDRQRETDESSATVT